LVATSEDIRGARAGPQKTPQTTPPKEAPKQERGELHAVVCLAGKEGPAVLR